MKGRWEKGEDYIASMASHNRSSRPYIKGDPRDSCDRSIALQIDVLWSSLYGFDVEKE
jgi:hypothetical protein